MFKSNQNGKDYIQCLKSKQNGKDFIQCLKSKQNDQAFRHCLKSKQNGQAFRQNININSKNLNVWISDIYCNQYFFLLLFVVRTYLRFIVACQTFNYKIVSNMLKTLHLNFVSFTHNKLITVCNYFLNVHLGILVAF